MDDSDVAKWFWKRITILTAFNCISHAGLGRTYLTHVCELLLVKFIELIGKVLLGVAIFTDYEIYILCTVPFAALYNLIGKVQRLSSL